MLATRALGPPAHAVGGVSILALGVTLLVAPLSVQGTAVITGIAICMTGLVLTLSRTEPPRLRHVRQAAGIACLGMGMSMAMWPDAGAPWLAFLAGSGIVLHGVISGTLACFSRTDGRVASLLAALAALIVGAVTFSWPVLTVTLVRFGVGAWLIFHGAQMLVALATSRPRARDVPSPVRRWTRTIGASLALLCAGSVAVGSTWILGAAPLARPDEFYVAPQDIPGARGQLIRVEPLAIGVPRGAEAFKILYTTTGVDGSPAVSSGTVLLPAERGSAPLPLITVAHGTTGVAPQCAPSLSATPFADGAGAALVDMVVTHGWAAVTSDYIGLGTAGPHPYLLGETEARNALDASVAVHDIAEMSFSAGTVVWGHSQGGQAALWAGQIAADYSPELTVLGVAAFAPASDLFGLANTNKREAPGKTVSAYIAATWNDIFPHLDLESQTTPGSARGIAKIEQLCFNGKDVIAAMLTGTQIPNQVFPDRLLDGEFGTLLEQQTPLGPFPAPVLVAQGSQDPLVTPGLQRQWVLARCDAGEVIDYRAFDGLDHLSLVAGDSPLTPQLIEWTLDRWAGTTSPAGCSGV